MIDINQSTSETILNSETKYIERVFNRDGSSNVKRTGLNSFASYNLYHKIVNVKWHHFFMFILSLYLFINSIFATIFYLLPISQFSEHSPEVNYGYWFQMFFVSVQSLTNIEYGHIHPSGVVVNLIRTIESLVGLLFFALMTGLLYGRFSKPTATLFYSNNVLVQPNGNTYIYSIRLANAKLSQLIEAKAQLVIALNEKNDGKIERKFHYVNVINDTVAFLNSSWTINHLADKDSPLFNLDANDLKNKNAEFILLIQAIDDTYATHVHTRISYKYSDVVWNADFKPILSVDDGKTYTDIKRISDYQSL